MSDLDPGLRSLIDDARDAEAPPDGARERVLDRVMARVTAAAAGAAATTAAATTAKASAGVATWLKVVLAGSLVVGAGVALSVSSDDPPPKVQQAAPGLTTTTEAIGRALSQDASADDDELPAEEPASVTVQEDPPEPNASAVEPAARSTSAAVALDEEAADTPPEDTEDPFALELRALRDARARLTSGDAAGALVTLDSYEAKQLKGALGQERVVVRVLALCQLGRVAEAQRAGALLLRLAPDSPTANRLRNSCAAPPATP